MCLTAALDSLEGGQFTYKLSKAVAQELAREQLVRCALWHDFLSTKNMYANL